MGIFLSTKTNVISFIITNIISFAKLFFGGLSGLPVVRPFRHGLPFLLIHMEGMNRTGGGGMMHPRRGKGWILAWLLLAVLAVWTFLRIYEWTGMGKREPVAVLYLMQVSAFQQRMLSGALSDSLGAKQTGELNALVRAVYSAQYSHERLLRAAESAGPPELAAYRELLSCLTGLQISGNRPLTEAEKAVLSEASESFKEFAAHYSELLTAHREWNRKEIEKLKKADSEMVKLLQESQLDADTVS